MHLTCQPTFLFFDHTYMHIITGSRLLHRSGCTPLACTKRMHAPTAQADEGEEEAAEEDHGDEDMGEEEDETEHNEGEDGEEEEAEQEPAPQKPPKVEPPQAAQPVAQPASVKKVLPPTSYHPDNSRAAWLSLHLLYLLCNLPS